MSRLWNIAVLGATGLVGETLIKVLEEREFPSESSFRSPAIARSARASSSAAATSR